MKVKTKPLTKFEFELLVCAIRYAYNRESILATTLPYDIIRNHLLRLGETEKDILLKELLRLEKENQENVKDGWILLRKLLEPEKQRKVTKSGKQVTEVNLLGEYIDLVSIVLSPYKYSSFPKKDKDEKRIKGGNYDCCV